MPYSKKAAIRKIAKNRRAELAKNYPDASDKLIEHFPFIASENHIIGGFLPISSEINPNPLMQELVKNGARLCLPRTSPITKAINFHAYKFGDKLEKGPLGIQEPSHASELLHPNVILVPFLAFDERGYRLGYGGGYYDRAISCMRKIKEIITIGVGFDGQKLDAIPNESHDEKLDYIITESKLYKFN
jgi:5-formyltetrahydrofolate cyclo-ligase